jgi:hypothetical protein
MKKVKIAIFAIGLIVCSSMPAKQVKAQSGHWYVSVHTLKHWVCTQGGNVCCPGFDC